MAFHIKDNSYGKAAEVLALLFVSPAFLRFFFFSTSFFNVRAMILNNYFKVCTEPGTLSSKLFSK